MHADAHVGGLLAAKGVFKVTATCDLNPQRAEQRAAELGAASVFTNYEELLARPDSSRSTSA
jgi:predicted dehydrogenase